MAGKLVQGFSLTATYSYDTLNRLTKSVATAWSDSYTYDPFFSDSAIFSTDYQFSPYRRNKPNHIVRSGHTTSGARAMKRVNMAMTAGLLSLAFCISTLLVWFGAHYIHLLSELKPTPFLLSVLAAVPLSVFSGFYWKRSLFGVTVLAVGMLLYVGLRLH